MPKNFKYEVDLDENLVCFKKEFTLSSSTSKVFQLVSSDELSVDDLSSAIVLDHDLTIRVLKLANSPYYGFSRKINTVKDAVVLLGQKSLRNMILMIALRGMRQNLGPLAKGLWEESAAVALAAQFLAENVEGVGVAPEEAFMAGLLCNIGELVLYNCDPKLYRKVLAESKHSGQREECSARLCAAPFSKISASMLQRWNFSLLMVLSAYYADEIDLRGDADDEIYRMCNVLFLARMIVRYLNIGNYSESVSLLAGGYAAELFEIDCERLDCLCDGFKSLFAEKGSLLVNS